MAVRSVHATLAAMTMPYEYDRISLGIGAANGASVNRAATITVGGVHATVVEYGSGAVVSTGCGSSTPSRASSGDSEWLLLMVPSTVRGVCRPALT